MTLGWIHVEDFDFNCLLLLERFQIALLCEQKSPEQRLALGTALRVHPTVAWYLSHRCPECAEDLAQIISLAPEKPDMELVRECELQVLSSIEDFVTYTRPELMDTHCNFIYGWDKERLFELADFAGKVVLDVGSGSGRLAFAAAQKAKEVYASEPVGTLREYLLEKISREKIPNVRVVDGMAHRLPYPDNTFDIVMSGHVVGDDYDGELSELTRVTKNGGWLLDCPGEDDRRHGPSLELSGRGFEEFHYLSKFGGDVYRYRKQVVK